MNLRKQAKIATVLALSTQDLLIQSSMQAHIRQKDVNISGLFSKISNLQLVAFDKREDDGRRGPDEMEMLQLGRSDSASVKTFALNGEELNEVMEDTFTPPQDKEPSVAEILQKQDQEEKEQAKKQKPQSLVEQSPSGESQNPEDMTISEHMSQVKKQTTQALEQIRKDKEEEERRKAEQKKKEEERKRQEEIAKSTAKVDTKKSEEREMDEFVEKQLQKQREDRERYDREILGKEPEQQEQKPEEQAPKKNIDDIINQHKQSKDKEVPLEEESAPAERTKNGFKNADEALEHFGQSIAQRQLESQIKIDKEKEEQEQKLNSAEKAEKAAQEKKERQEKEKKEKEEKQKRDEEQRLYDDRKDRLLNKLHSFGGGGEEVSAQPGFFEQAQKRMEAEKNVQQEDQEKQVDKERDKIVQQSQEEPTAVDVEAARKARLQQKLESFQMAEESAPSDQPTDSANEKQLNATAEEIVNGRTPPPKLQPPAEESVQTVKEVHVNNQMLEDINKNVQFTSLVDQVEKEQIAKAAKARAEQLLREEKEKQKSLQDQQALQRELENEKAAQQLAQQQLEISSLPPPVASPVAAPSAPAEAEKEPSVNAAAERKFDIHQLIKDAVQHNKEAAPKPAAAPPKPARSVQSTPPPVKKPPKVTAVQAPPAKAKPAPLRLVKPVAKVVKKEVPPAPAALQQLAQEPTPMPAPAPPVVVPPTPSVAPSGSLLQTQQNVETKAPKPAEPEVAEVSQERLNAKLQKELAENGVKEPSDITKALIDDSTNDQISGHGFFGKYLKKHRDMKKKAQEQLIREDLELKARKERLKKEMSEKIKADPRIQTPGGVIQKKKKKKTLSERAHQKLIDEQNTKDAEAQEKAQMVVQVSQLAQLPNLGLEINLAPRSEGST